MDQHTGDVVTSAHILTGDKVSNAQINSIGGVAKHGPSNLTMHNGTTVKHYADVDLSSCTDQKLIQEIDNRLIIHGILLPKKMDVVKKLFNFEK